MAKAGRPSKYTPKLGMEICRRMAEGESLRKICRDDDMPNISTVVTWALGKVRVPDEDGFPAQYARARELRSELYADELIDLADDDQADTQRSRLQIDARKWVASKLLPKTYGERVAHEHTGEDGAPIGVLIVPERDLPPPEPEGD